MIVNSVYILHVVQLCWNQQTNITEKYQIYEHYNNPQTNILNDHLHYKSHTHSNHTRISASSNLSMEKWLESQLVPLGQSSIKNGAHCTENLLNWGNSVMILHSDVINN